jgi:putrescine transport system substrate-binding protein
MRIPSRARLLSLATIAATKMGPRVARRTRARLPASVLCALTVCACVKHDTPEAGGLAPPAAAGGPLAVYNWADFIGQHTVRDFEQATGIPVVYDTYDAEMTVEAKLLAGDSGYDVVFPSMDYVARQLKAHVYAPLDKSSLPNWKNLDPQALAVYARVDPGNRYAVPYLHSITGFIYNADMVRARMPDAPVDSLDMLFAPKVIARFADCGVSFIDTAQDVLALALNYLHLDPSSQRPEDFAAAERLLLSVRPFIRSFDSVGQINELANGELCIAMSWSGDYAISTARARAAGVHVNLAFTVPKEGTNIIYDAMMIPGDAPHKREAHAFLNYMLEPKVIAAVTNELYYPNDNAAAAPYVDPAILANPALYPTAHVFDRLYQAHMGNAATERMRTRAWTRIKTGR